ncbi:hypothetical protein C2E23DRAFT_856174 [Lenzites betulinus]|nr:hypothetical protein C2E23DRAFT_856174 [Lenzites betulinus]
MTGSEAASSSSTCTCGHCFEGWLSPRMRERLEYSAELRYGLAKSLLDTQDGVPADITRTLPIDYARIDVAFYYLPPALRAQIGETDGPGDALYRGYIVVLEAAKDLATAESQQDDATARSFPSVSDLTARLSSLRSADSSPGSGPPLEGDARAHLAAYLDAGGSAEHALDCIVDRAREELSPLGRLYDAEKRYIDAVLDGGGDADGAPRVECANDLDFALVRCKLGLGEETRGADVPLDEGWDPVSDEDEDGE